MNDVQLKSVDLCVRYQNPADLIPYERNARTHSDKQITKLMASMRQFGFNAPVLVDADNLILAGHARVEAARRLGLTSVPTICLGHLSEAKKRAYILADNKLAEEAGWDKDILRLEMEELLALPDLDFSIEATGFSTTEIDLLMELPNEAQLDAKADAIPAPSSEAISRLGDLWQLGAHRLLVGDARKAESYRSLMMGASARMVFTDPPFNVPVDGHVMGLGKVRHREFAMASGEMSEAEFTRFLTEVCTQMAAFSVDGAIHFICMDWRHLGELLTAGRSAYDELKNLICWTKTNAGMGSFYRSQHELILAFKKGKAAHTNNFGLGETGRYRTNVWQYQGINSFGRNRDAELAMHPTVKPVALVADAIRDVSARGDIVLDPFGGSGTTLIAAEKTGRVARLIELDPIYADVICGRWEAFSGEPALLNGETSFAAVADERLGAIDEAAQ